jgi:hypothetical protein
MDEYDLADLLRDYKYKFKGNFYPDQNLPDDTIMKMAIAEADEKDKKRKGMRLSELLQAPTSQILSDLTTPQAEAQAYMRQNPDQRQALLQAQEQAVQQKQDAGGTFINQDLTPYKIAGIQSQPSQDNVDINTPGGAMGLFAKGLGQGIPAGELQAAIALGQKEKPTPIEKTIFGPRGQTKIVNIPKGQDYIPPQGWSLDKGSVDYFGSPTPGAMENAKVGTQTGAKNEAALDGLDEGHKEIVKKLSEYKMPLPSGFALKAPFWQSILERTALYDPSFDATQYNVRLGVRKDFTAGKSSQNIRSLNTAIAHLDTLKDKADELKNSDIPLWNEIANRSLTAVGDKRVVGFENAATAVESELASVFKGTGATDQEIKQWRQNIKNIQSPAQIDESIGTAVQLLGGRLGALQNQYEMGMGKPLDFQILSDKSRQILKKRGFNLGQFEQKKKYTILGVE